MTEYHESATINLHAPIDKVFAFITDIERLSSWAGAFDAITDYSGQPIEVGSTWTAISKFMGREVVSQCRVTALDSPNQFVFSITNMAGDGTNTWALESLNEAQTRVTLSLDGEAKGIAKMAVGLIRSQADKQMNSDLANLKRLLEASS